MKIHAYCAAFPDVSKEDDKEMAEDIQSHGQADPILTYKKQVIDGKNRLRWCEIAGVVPLTKEWRPRSKHPKDIDDELYAFVISKNLKRRHLDKSQRAAAAVELAAARGISMDQAAEEVEVSPALVDMAKHVHKNGSAELFNAVKDGTVKASDAMKIVHKPKAEQRKAIQRVRSGKTRTVAEMPKPDAEVKTPFDEVILRLEWAFKQAIPGLIELALDIQKALGAGSGSFSASQIQASLAKVDTPFHQVKGVLLNAQQKSRRRK